MVARNEVTEDAENVVQCEAEINEKIQQQNELREQKELLIKTLELKCEKFCGFNSHNARLIFNGKLRNSYASSLNNTRELGKEIYTILEEAHADFDNIESKIQSNKQKIKQHKDTLSEHIIKQASQIDRENMLIEQDKAENEKANRMRQEEQEILRQNAELQEELNKITKEWEGMGEEYNDLKSKLLFEESELINQIKIKEEENGTIWEKIEQLDAELSRFQPETDESLKEIQQRINEGEQELQSITNSFEELQQEYQIVQQEILCNQSKEKSLAEKTEAYKNGMENITQHISELKNNLESEISAINRKTEEAKVSIENASAALMSITKEKEEITSLIMKLKQETHDINNNTNTLQISDLEKTMVDLKKEYEKSLSDFETVNNEILKYEKAANEKDNQLQGLLSDIEARQTKYSNQMEHIQTQHNKEVSILDKQILDTENGIKEKQVVADENEAELQKQMKKYEEALNTTNFKSEIEKIEVETNNLTIKHAKICEQIKSSYKPSAKDTFVKPVAAKPNKAVRNWDSDSSIEGAITYSQHCMRMKKYRNKDNNTGEE